MLKLLLLNRIQAWLAYLGGPKKIGGKAGAKPGKGRVLLFGILYIYLAAVFLFIFFMLFSALAGAMGAMGLGWFYFAFFVMIAFALMVFFSIYTAKAQLYEAKDNELLLSMPIKPSVILASRMLSLLLINFGFELLVAVPAAVAWVIAMPVSVGGAVSFVLICLALPFFGLAVSALLGWLLSIITAKVRRKSLVGTLGGLIFLVVYFGVYSRINELLTALVSHAGAIADSVSAVLPLVWLGKAAAEGDFLRLIPGLVCLLLPFALVYILLSKTFVRIATTHRGAAKFRYVRREEKRRSAFSALFRREAGRLLSSSTYMLNSAIGSVMSIVLAVLILVQGQELLAGFAVDAGAMFAVEAVVLLGLCTLSSMTTISACSVSLEGKHLWIVRSMPVDSSAVLRAKLALHLVVSAPGMLVAQLVCIWVLRPTGLMLLWMLLLPQVYNIFLACFGQWANINHPRLEWQSETQPVKQGVAVPISMFGGMAMLILPAVAGVLLRNVPHGIDIAAGASLVIFAALAAVLYKWCMGRGAEIFEKL